MTDKKVVADVTGTMGTVLWCIQLTPQIFFNYRRKNCEGFPPLMMFLWMTSGVPFSIYFCVNQSNIPVQVQPQLFTALCTVTWIQTLYYPPTKTPIVRMIAYAVSFVLVALALELGFILWLRPLYSRGVEWPNMIFGIIAAVMLALGLLPPYFELAKRQGRVIGINFLFIGLDCLGAVFSFVSVQMNSNEDIIGMVLYVVIMVLEVGIFISQGIWLVRFRVFAERNRDISFSDGHGHKEELTDS